MTDYVYNAAFNENILVAGKTKCGKLTFVEKLGVNSFFGKLFKL